MIRSTWRRLFAAALLFVTLTTAGKSSAQTVVHGADSLYADATVKLAWAMLKGGSEETTVVVLRIVNTTGAYRFVRADGVDPFTKDRANFAGAQPLADRLDLRVPRARFADHPSLEVMFDRTADALEPGRAALTIYYLGVPDTTPEFLTQADADAYLAKMLAKN